jgi:hypothetical protein
MIDFDSYQSLFRTKFLYSVLLLLMVLLGTYYIFIRTRTLGLSWIWLKVGRIEDGYRLF